METPGKAAKKTQIQKRMHGIDAQSTTIPLVKNND
jgi:hypothetical protein